MLGDGAVLFLRAAAHADAAGDPAVYEQRIAAGHQRDPGVVGLNGHQGAALHRGGGHIFGLALGDGRRIGLPRHQGDAQRQRLAVPPVTPGADRGGR